MSKFSCFTFANTTNKTVTRTAHTWGLLIANHLELIMIDQSEILSRGHVQFITLFFGGAQLCCAFYQLRATCTNLMPENQFSELNWHILTFHNKFYCLESHTEHRWRWSKDLFKLWDI